MPLFSGPDTPEITPQGLRISRRCTGTWRTQHRAGRTLTQPSLKMSAGPDAAGVKGRPLLIPGRDQPHHTFPVTQRA